jgi:hypothetical protein
MLYAIAALLVVLAFLIGHERRERRRIDAVGRLIVQHNVDPLFRQAGLRLDDEG